MIRKDNELTTESFRTASYIIFTPSYFESQLYNVNTGTKLNGVSGDYKNLGKQFKGKQTYMKPKSGFMPKVVNEKTGKTNPYWLKNNKSY